MPSIFLKFEIDSTVEFPSDHFNLSFVGSGPFRNKTNTDTVDLSIGLLSSTGAPQVISFIENGITDEFEIVIVPNSITGTKNGRDGIALALDSYFEKRYYRFPEVVPPYPPINDTTGQPIPQVDSTGTPLPLPPPGVSGIFTASQIAREAAASVGVGLVWGCPDYELLENFFATGRIIDTINKLIQPFTLVNPFKADIYSNGRVLVIQPRNPFSAPNFTISMAEAKRSSVTLRVRYTQLYGQVWLTGAANPLATDRGIWVEGESLEESTDEAKDVNGKILSRVVTTETKITPTGQTKIKVVEIYAPKGGAGGDLVLTGRTTETNEYTIGTFGIVGPIAPKVLLSTTTVREGYNKSKVWGVVETYERGLSYDHFIGTGKQTSETELTKTLKNGVLTPSTLRVKTTKDSGYLLVEHVTTNFTYQKDSKGILQPVYKNQDIQRQAGFRAGGPSALPQRAGGGTGEQERLVRTISVSPLAVKVVQNLPEIPLLPVGRTTASLTAIMEQFRQASGLWEYEAALVGVNMPWIRRGMYIQLTDVESEIPGTLIDLPVMLVTEVMASYDESVIGAKSVSKIRAFGWRST